MRLILIVDDDLAIAGLLVDILATEGYAVQTATNGALALEQMHRQRPDLVLLDLMMPVLDGWGVLQACRQDTSLAELPIVLLSAGHDAPRGEPAVKAFVAKPFDMLEFLMEQLALSVRHERVDVAVHNQERWGVSTHVTDRHSLKRGVWSFVNPVA